jgi:REP element-mobilizing transposase RayT
MQKRKIAQDVWYEIRSQINNREQLFRRSVALALFDRVFREARLRFVFTVRDLRLEDDWLSFYIKPEDGLELPAIMKWLKQTFAQRYNRLTGRIGHIWGDRYWSEILAGEPPAALEAAKGDRPLGRNRSRGAGFSGIFPSPPSPAPG